MNGHTHTDMLSLSCLTSLEHMIKKQVLQHCWFLAYQLSIEGLILISWKRSLSPGCLSSKGIYVQELAATVESVLFAVRSTTALSGVGKLKKKWNRQALRQCSDLTLTGRHRQSCKKSNPAVYVGHTTEEKGWKMAAMRVAGTCVVVL